MRTGERIRNARGQGDRLRVALIDALASELDELGEVSAVSLRRVTARAGVTPNALYLHFTDLAALVLALEERSFGELHDRLVQAELAAGDDPWDRLMSMCDAYCEFAELRPALYRLLFGTYVPGGRVMPRDAAERAAASKNAGVATFDALARALARWRPDSGDPFPTAVRVWCALHGYVSLQPVMPSFPFPERREFLSHVLRGQAAARPCED